MNPPPAAPPQVAIACGGTGGHLFPGIAVGREVLRRGGRVTLFISEKEVDRQAVAAVDDMRVVALPSVGLVKGRWLAFLAGVVRSRRLAKECFRADPPQVVLAMGGFTSAGPVLAARSVGAGCFLHDSNVIPGRANRWLATFAEGVFVAFPETQKRFKCPSRVTGTPVRQEFHAVNPAVARETLGLRADDPVLLIMGGSQGAAGVNRLMLEALPLLVERFPRLQFIHLTGAADLAAVQSTYLRLGVKALVQVFCASMHHALGAATLTVSRSGGSSLAEIAACRTPAVLIPYPAAADRHQQFNAEALERHGAAVIVDEKSVSGTAFGQRLIGLLDDPAGLAQLRERLAHWQPLDAAARIADALFARLPARAMGASPASRSPAPGARPPSTPRPSLTIVAS